ncbi:MAG: hypothetical protein ABI690_05940 [Chloroflexota bacterium]
MSLGRRPPRTSRRGRDGPPAWLIFLVGIALVFGGYYLWLGAQNFLRTGGKGVVEATERAVIVSTATAQSFIPTREPTSPFTPTPVPECQRFIVNVPNARVRQSPSENSATVDSLFQNQEVCVLGRAAPGSEWYVIDQNSSTRRLELAYMHESVLQAVNPTPTPSRTPSPLPTITATPSLTLTPVTPSSTPRPTNTPNPATPDTPTPTLTPSPTVPRQNA